MPGYNFALPLTQQPYSRDPNVRKDIINHHNAITILAQRVSNDAPLERFVRLTTQTDIDNMQAIHDALKAAGGGYMEIAYGVYTPITPVNVDVTLVGIKAGRARFNISGIADNVFWLNLYCGMVTNNDTVEPIVDNLLTYENLHIYGDFAVNAGGTTGPCGIRFNSTLASATIRVQFHRLKIRKCWIALSYYNRCPFIRIRDFHIRQNGKGLVQEAGPTDYTELNTFETGIFDGNDLHISTPGGGYWRFSHTSFDYPWKQTFEILFGAKLILENCHIEFNYGQTAGQTQTPITMGDQNSSFIMHGGTIAYAGTGQNPYWSSLITSSHSSHQIDIDCDISYRLGRLTDTAGYDAWVLAANSSAFPRVRIKAMPFDNGLSHAPAMSFVNDFSASTGMGGILRQGIESPLSELAHRMQYTAGVTVTQVVADENGMTLPNAHPVLRFENTTGLTEKLWITFPVYEPSRRHAWMLFTNMVAAGGSFTVREKQGGFGHKYDGSTFTLVPDARTNYSANTITATGGSSNSWVRRSWKDCNTQSNPNARQMIAEVITIEFDLSLLTGYAYVGKFSYDII